MIIEYITLLQRFEETTQIRVRFVIGHSTDQDAEYRLQVEQEEHDDFVRLNFEVCCLWQGFHRRLDLGTLLEFDF